jgi:capsular polysaccharide biosynthesis protein
MIRDVLPAEVFASIPSPGFFMRPPDLRHAERIPADVRASMGWAWNRGWFAPRMVEISVLEDVFVVEEGLVITRALEVVRSSVQQHDEAAVARGRAAVAEALRHGAAPRVRGDVVLCRKPGSWNYGHFLCEMLPRVWVARQHWPAPARVMIQTVTGKLRQVMHDALGLLGVADIVEADEAVVAVDRLLLVDGLTEHGIYMSPLVMACLDALTSGIAADGDARLFVTRGGMAGRRLVDEAGVLAEATRAGFTIFDPAGVPFARQVAAFKAARRVAGVMGAALTNLAFVPSQTEVFTLAPACMPDTFFWFIGGLRDARAVEIRCAQEGAQTGPRIWDRDVRFDTADRALVFGQAGAGAAPARTQREMLARLGRLFDAGFYLASNPDVAAAGMDPLEHYVGAGWREGRRPSAGFDGGAYLAAHADAVGICPLVHAVTFGEG